MGTEYTEYFAVHAPSLHALRRTLEAHRIRSIVFMEEVEGSSFFYGGNQAIKPTWQEYEALPPARRWAAMLTDDATLDRLAPIFPRVLRLEVDTDPELWSLDLALNGKQVHFLFTDPRFPYFRFQDDEELIRASASPTAEQLASLEEMFSVPRDKIVPHLRMGGAQGFAAATGVPYHYPLAQAQVDWTECIPKRRNAIFLDDFID
ncbi:hypothetical protein WMF38_48225 [Sorangium sp. So ce118]